MVKIVSYCSSITNGTTRLQDSTGKSIVSSSPTDLLNFLVFSCSATHPSSVLKCVWDLDILVSHIARLLPLDICKSISSPEHRAIFGSYRIYYIPSKIFSVNKDHIEVTFYSLDQYYPDLPDPANITDLQSLADNLLDTLSGLGISSPTNLTSPIAVAEGSPLLKEYQSTIPTIADTPETFMEAQEYALQCCSRDWTSNYQIGCWEQDELWGYDQSAAFPYLASRLPDMRSSSYSKSSTMLESAYWGFLRGKFTVYTDSPYAFCSPFLIDRGDGTMVNFTGTRNNYYCLLDEVRYLYRYGLGEFKIKDGWFITPYNSAKPFQSLMTELYRYRPDSAPLASYFLKRVANGIIGKLLQRRANGSYGDLYNPVYHSIITTHTRLRDFDFLVKNQITSEELVHIGTDGCRLTRYIPLPSVSSQMGQWRCTGSQPTVVLSPGLIFTPERSPKGISYPLLRAMIVAHPRSSRYETNIERSITLSEAIEGGNVSSVGDTKCCVAGVDLNTIHLLQDRHFAKLPKTGAALIGSKYYSEPIEM